MMWAILVTVAILGIIILQAISRAGYTLGTALDELHKKADDLTEKVDAMQEKLEEIEDSLNGKRYVNPIEFR